MKSKGHALLELVLCLGMGGTLLFGSGFLRHVFRARSAALTLVENGSALAAHPELSDNERIRVLNEASQRLFACPYCHIQIDSHRYLDQPSARFYDFVETKAVVHLGHDRLRALFLIPDTLEESAVVAREPNHAVL